MLPLFLLLGKKPGSPAGGTNPQANDKRGPKKEVCLFGPLNTGRWMPQGPSRGIAWEKQMGMEVHIAPQKLEEKGRDIRLPSLKGTPLRD
jgi:hypothetical protein